MAQKTGEMHGRDHLPDGRDPIPDVVETADPFPDEIASLATSRELRGYWRLGEPSGSWLDTAGYTGDGLGAADATLTTVSVALTRDITGALPVADDDGAIQLNDSSGTASNYLSIPTKSARYELQSHNLSVSAWVNPTALGANFAGVCGHMYVSSTPFGWGLSVNSSGQPMFRRETASFVSRILGPVMPLGSWVFLVGTYSTSGGHKLYMDGSLVAVDAQTFNIAETSNQSPKIGQLPTFGGAAVDRSFYGGIDEVAYWGGTLTASEVATLAESGGLATGDISAITVYNNYTIQADDDVLVTDVAVTLTITLPVISTVPAGKRYTVKKGSSGTGTITVARNGATIDGAASDVSITTASQAREFTSDGSGWRITAGYL